jgi:hypothetical protein
MKKRDPHSAVEIIVNEMERKRKAKNPLVRGSTGAVKGPAKIPSLASMRADRNRAVKDGRLVVWKESK